MKTAYRALDTHVLAVVREGAIGDWAAYIGAVDGKRHEDSVEKVASNGTKLPKALAEMLFPEFKRMVWRE